jgi:SAM-dependent methyltransferase
MTEVDFDQYSEQSIHFFSRRVPELLTKSIKHIGPSATLVDFGCGDGHLVWALSETGQISPNNRVFGVDISPIRLRRFQELTGFQGIMADGHLIPALETASVDLALSTMVIEHVPDDLGHVRELARITRPGGMMYMTTVIRKRGAWYFRKAPDGRRVLDPTHLREYASEGDVIRMIEKAGFVISEQRLSRLVFPLAHPLIRWLHARRPIKDVQRLFLKRFTGWIEILALPIPRYRAIEIVAKRAFDPIDPTQGTTDAHED